MAPIPIRTTTPLLAGIRRSAHRCELQPEALPAVPVRHRSLDLRRSLP
jgi:hypothetical protein